MKCSWVSSCQPQHGHSVFLPWLPFWWPVLSQPLKYLNICLSLYSPNFFLALPIPCHWIMLYSLSVMWSYFLMKYFCDPLVWTPHVFDPQIWLLSIGYQWLTLPQFLDKEWGCDRSIPAAFVGIMIHINIELGFFIQFFIPSIIILMWWHPSYMKCEIHQLIASFDVDMPW